LMVNTFGGRWKRPGRHKKSEGEKMGRPSSIPKVVGRTGPAEEKKGKPNRT